MAPKRIRSRRKRKRVLRGGRFAEIKQGAEALTTAERAELRAHLRLLDLKNDRKRQAGLFALARTAAYVDEAQVRRLIESRSGAWS